MFGKAQCTTYSIEGAIHKKEALNKSSEISQMSGSQLGAGQIFVDCFAQHRVCLA